MKKKDEYETKIVIMVKKDETESEVGEVANNDDPLKTMGAIILCLLGLNKNTPQIKIDHE